MKQLLMVLVIYTTAFSQEDMVKQRKVGVGFILGADYNNVFIKTSQENASFDVRDKLGMRFGIFCNVPISRIVAFAPKIELAINNMKFNDNYGFDVRLNPGHLDLSPHFQFTDYSKKVQPYFLVGPTLRLPISDKKIDYNKLVVKDVDFAIDFGIGIQNEFNHFVFAPELRYSIGMANLYSTQSLQRTQLHTLTLALKFRN